MAAAQKAPQTRQARGGRDGRPAGPSERQSGESGGPPGASASPPPPPRLKERYRAEIAPALREEFGYSNVMQIPGLSKIVGNMGVGEAARDAKLIDGAVKDLTLITGQKPQVRRATKSIAQFKLREGMPIGAKVTLRNDRMWEFLDRLLSIALPRIRDFRGLDGRKLDGNGNYTFGLTEQSVFHEINQAYHDRVTMPYSKIKANIAEVLKSEGYVFAWQVQEPEEGKVGKTLVVDLKYGQNRERSLAGIRRVSKPGLRVYAKSVEMPRV